ELNHASREGTSRVRCSNPSSGEANSGTCDRTRTGAQGESCSEALNLKSQVGIYAKPNITNQTSGHGVNGCCTSERERGVVRQPCAGRADRTGIAIARDTREDGETARADGGLPSV